MNRIEIERRPATHEKAADEDERGGPPRGRAGQGFDVGVVGATGAVGEILVRQLFERGFPLRELRLLASERSAGRALRVGDRALEVHRAEPDAVDGLDFVFFAATGSLSKELAPAVVRAGGVAIDKSSTFRMDARVPLVVPEVNARALAGHDGIIACPNCTTIGLVMALAPLEARSPLRRVVATTLQSVSGAGRDGIDELRRIQADPGARPSVFAAPIAGNVVPLCDRAIEDGWSSEEHKLVDETRRILERPDLKLHATCVRVPVEVGHAASVIVEQVDPLGPDEARMAWDAFPGVEVVDDWAAGVFPTPLAVEGRDDVLVGRARRDPSSGGLAFFEASDNLRKGAATNAIQIAETLAGAVT